MLLDWRTIWIGLDRTENGWTGFGFLEDLDGTGLIVLELLELQWSNAIRQELSLFGGCDRVPVLFKLRSSAG
jgi:hypothetical protein